MEIWIFSYARPPSKKVQKDYVSKPGKIVAGGKVNVLNRYTAGNVLKVDSTKEDMVEVGNQLHCSIISASLALRVHYHVRRFLS
jgi:hypothetical protein